MYIKNSWFLEGGMDNIMYASLNFRLIPTLDLFGPLIIVESHETKSEIILTRMRTQFGTASKYNGRLRTHVSPSPPKAGCA